LTTAGTGWSLPGPPHKGKQQRPSPGGGRGKPSLTYKQQWDGRVYRRCWLLLIDRRGTVAGRDRAEIR
ncbi:MAG: hypothetical protein ACTHQQ_02595, partial [Solirubrobacteraceae bacterium]